MSLTSILTATATAGALAAPRPLGDTQSVNLGARVFFETGLQYADSDVFPNFTEASRFRALRDAMRAPPAP